MNDSNCKNFHVHFILWDANPQSFEEHNKVPKNRNENSFTSLYRFASSLYRYINYGTEKKLIVFVSLYGLKVFSFYYIYVNSVSPTECSSFVYVY
jgi:hypothetical protein